MDSTNRTFIITFGLMMATIVYLSGCNAIESKREPTALDCRVNCTSEGDCFASIQGVGEVNIRERKITLDTPTQTKVGLDDD